ncbi:carbonic anhydrase [Schlesneria sp. DSM 10557]|uniref:carbonic anhydrase n=1 Tax=Schlesneria sp. DSM 10557 TaxID=3044399 RepID=UPI0035A19DA0
MISQLLTGNQRFVESEFNRNLDYYHSIAAAQTPAVLWIGCSDSRVSEDVITGSKPGTMFVHRNVANIIAYNDVNFAALLEYGVTYLKIPDIVVCGHTRCGGIKAIVEGVKENYIADWLQIAAGIRDEVEVLAQQQGLSQDQKLDLLSKENVKLQIKHLNRLSFIRRMHEKGSIPRIHGWLYSVDTGKIEVLVDGHSAAAHRPG